MYVTSNIAFDHKSWLSLTDPIRFSPNRSYPFRYLPYILSTIRYSIELLVKWIIPIKFHPFGMFSLVDLTQPKNLSLPAIFSNYLDSKRKFYQYHANVHIHVHAGTPSTRFQKKSPLLMAILLTLPRFAPSRTIKFFE